MPFSVKIITLGCPKNSVDSRQMQGYLIQAGYQPIEDISLADIIIINTCGFIEDAKRESIQEIINALQWKKEGACKKVVVAGCLAQKYAEELSRDIPEVDAIIGTADIPLLPEILNRAKNKGPLACIGDPNAFLYNMDLPPIRPETGHYAYLKIAEGCDNRCSYCVIPQMRGSYRSRPPEDILKEASVLASQGVKEIILVAQDTTLYGTDLSKKQLLPHLLKELTKIADLRWIRMLYSYPAHITNELLYTIKNEEKICSYLDIPLQHISDRVLRRMGRPASRAQIENLFHRIRQIIPEVMLRSTFIVGFPGETQEDFAELLLFLEKMQFDRAGFFTYSREPGTLAAGLSQQISKKEKIRRKETAVALQNEILAAKQSGNIGKNLVVMVDGPSEDYTGLWEGRTQGDAPEIDGVVYFRHQQGIKPGNLVVFRATHSQEYALMGEILNELS